MKNLGKSFAVLLCIALAVCMLAVNVAAEETTYAASVGDTQYATVAEAVAAANGQTVKLLANSEETVTVSGDLYLDLNGYTLAGLTVTDGTLYGIDTTTDDYISDEGYGKITAFTGSHAQHHQVEINGNPQRYLAVEEESGISFHRFYLGITHNSLQPAASGVGYKALFCGDVAVKAQLDTTQAFGYSLWLDGYNAINRWKSAEDFAAEKTLTLRVKNYDEANYGDTALYAAVQLKLADGTVISSAEQSATLKQMVEAVNSDVAGYSTAQIDALSAWIKTSETMLGWSVANILQEPISYDMNTGADLVVYTEQTGTLQSITVKDTELTLENATLANGVLTIPAASFRQEFMPSGRLTLIVTTDTEEVQYTGDFTWVIQDWANTIGGLAYSYKHLVADGNVYTGSLALGADIDLTGKTISNFVMFKMANEFNGTFDGRNHTITGLKPSATTGLFGTIGTNGVVENLKLTGVQITTYGGGVAYICKGKLQNIYVEGSITGDGMGETSDLGNFGSGLLAGIFNATAKVDNCIVEVTSIADGLRLATAFGRMRGDMNESIFTYCNAVNADGCTFMKGVVVSEEETTWTKESFSWDYTNANFATMSDLWKDTVAAALATQLGLENPNAPKDVVLENAFDMNVTGNDLVVENTKLTGTLQSVTLGGVTLANATLVDGTLTVPAASFIQDTMPSGNLTLTVTTDTEEIQIEGEFVWVIKDWVGLAYMEKHMVSDGTAYTGSLALGADLDISGKTPKNFMWKTVKIFNGTFDGRNHTISNYNAASTTYGLFVELGENSVVKNLKMTNVTVSTYAGGLAYYAKGTIENVYFQGTITADGMGASSNLANFGSGLLAGQYYATAKVNNCIVELTSITDGLRLATAFGKLRGGVIESIFSNCYAVGADNCTYIESTNWAKLSFTTGGTNANFAAMSDLWQNSAAAAVAAGLGLENPNAPKDITLENEFDMNVTGNDLVVENTKLTGTLQSVTVAGTDGNQITLGATLENGILTIPAASFVQKYMPSGQVTLTVATDTEQIGITGEFVWNITSWADTMTSGLAYMHFHLTTDGTSYYGHLALGNDIALTSSNNPANFTMGSATFEGTFDGRNHTISGLAAKSAGKSIFHTIGENGVVKNLKLTGVTVSTYTGAVAYMVKGTLENIYVQGSITADGMGASSNLANFGCGLLAGQYYNTAQVNNCIVELTSIADGLRLGTAFGKLRTADTESIFSNCYAIGAEGCTFMQQVSDIWTKQSFTEGGTNANFATLADLAASDNVLAIALATLFGLI